MKFQTLPQGMKGILKPIGRIFAHILSRLLPREFMTYRGHFDIWQARGFHVVPAHFYYPVPDTSKLPSDVWESHSEMPGVDLNLSAQEELLSNIAPRYQEELTRFHPHAVKDSDEYYYFNPMFGPGDADILYTLIRRHSPNRYLEIGSGFSTRMAAAAVRANVADGGHSCEIVAIEPYPSESLRHGFPGLSTLLAEPVQTQPLSLFTSLEKDDILFIDSSHVLKIGSDVQYEFLEILPRLRSGVLVHFHDIYLPYEYPEPMIRNNHMFWTEQYLLQAFLAHNDAFEILWMGHYLYRTHHKELSAVFPHCASPAAWPTSVWIRKR